MNVRIFADARNYKNWLENNGNEIVSVVVFDGELVVTYRD